MNFDKNKKLKLAIRQAGKTHNQVAGEMEITKECFGKKINHNILNGYMLSFSFCEKFYLSVMFGVAIKDIE